MYSTNIRNKKCFIECITVSQQINMIKFLVDTGAMFTCCNCKVFDTNIKEKDLKKNETKFLGGFVKGLPVKFYKCSLHQLTIGNIDMGKQDIWVTFDERVNDAVLGMDILLQVILTVNSYDQKIYFCKDREDYNTNFNI